LKAEVKCRKAGQSDLATRLGTNDPNAPDWYDAIPDKKVVVESIAKPWTLAGDLVHPQLPRLIVVKKHKQTISDYGYVIRVTTSLHMWDTQKSDYVYLDAYEPGEDVVRVFRVEVAKFDLQFKYAFDNDLAVHEALAKNELMEFMKAGGARDYGLFINSLSDYIDQFYLVWICN
jgi:hypothetical protein